MGEGEFMVPVVVVLVEQELIILAVMDLQVDQDFSFYLPDLQQQHNQ
jgi:hypothetical protein